MLRNISPDSEVGYRLKFEGMIIAASIGKKKTTDGGESNSCTIIIRGLSFSEASNMLEKNYRVRKIDSFKQGVSKMVMYEVTLAGYQKDMAMSIQAAEGFALISLFELFSQ